MLFVPLRADGANVDSMGEESYNTVRGDEAMENEFTQGSAEITETAEQPVIQQTPAAQAPAAPQAAPQENVISGIVGAFLFSLAGGVCWFLLSRVGFIAAASGLVGIVCAIKGYAVFGKKESTKGIVISTVIALLVLAAAWYLSYAYDLLEAYQSWFENGEVDFLPSYADCVRNGYLLFEDPEIAGGYLKDLAFGMVLAIVGCAGTVSARIKAAKATKAAKKESGSPEF